MTVFAYVLSAAAIVLMAFNVWLIINLLRRFKGGGEIGNRIRWLFALIVFFSLGYIVSPFLVVLGLPTIWLVILVFAVFFFGALYVTITLSILRKILSVLDFIKKS